MTATAASLRRTGTSRAAAVSAALRKAGFLPGSSTNSREGIKVSWAADCARVWFDFASDATATRLLDDAWLALEEKGYTVEPTAGTSHALEVRKVDW